jgi:hypothetical protein
MKSDNKALPLSAVREIVDKLEREGKLVRTGRNRNGQPVYVHVDHATEEELEAARRRKH